MVTHNLNVLEKHSVFSGDSLPRNFATSRVKRRSIKSEDPMSHRIIEKRRRDRMNNCLADLSRLIPPEYLKKGRGRIEKTEIIEMAIKHIGHLQHVIASARFNENSISSIPSPPVSSSTLTKEISSPLNQPLTVTHYKKGYLECMSEAMHFLVEVQGYFAGDTLCVQMINHLRQHCDKILNGNAFDLSKSQTSGDLTSSECSSSPINIINNGSPPLGIFHSSESHSDDYQPNMGYPMDECYSPKSYSDFYYNLKKHSNNSYREYVESYGIDKSENRSAFENCSNNLVSCQDQKDKIKNPRFYGEPEKVCHRNYHWMSNALEPVIYENVPVKDENGSSVMRDMLTSGADKPLPDSNTSRVPYSNSSESIFPTKGSNNPEQESCLKAINSSKGNSDISEESHSVSGKTNHVIMYKFKNNIKQRFSRERSENAECGQVERDQCLAKKPKSEECQRWERVSFGTQAIDTEIEEVHKLNHTETESKRSLRFPPKLTFQSEDTSIKLNFGHHKATERETMKRWKNFGSSLHCSSRSWMKTNLPIYQFPEGCKPLNERLPSECSTLSDNSFPAETFSPGIPIFALHAKRSFYIPLTLDQATLAPFLPLLGLAKGSNSSKIDEKPVLHPVTISVNFHSHMIR